MQANSNSQSKIDCPKCNVKMMLVKAGDIELDQCPQCEGIWVDTFEEKKALQMKPEIFTIDELRNLRKVYQPLGKLEKVRYFKCPHCGGLMWRKNYMSFSGIVVDKCDDHGTFFDKGELEKAIEFVKKGGAEFEKFKRDDMAIRATNDKLRREVDRVETTMYRLHWIGRFLSTMGF